MSPTGKSRLIASARIRSARVTNPTERGVPNASILGVATFVAYGELAERLESRGGRLREASLRADAALLELERACAHTRSNGHTQIRIAIRMQPARNLELQL